MGQPSEGQARGVKFVSIHHHGTFSFQDAIGTPAEHAEVAAGYGMTALAITDHGNVSGHVQHEKACLKRGIKPLFGLEAYTATGPQEARKFHQTIVAMNQVGLTNLYRIVSESWENFYKWPTVTGAMLAAHHEVRGSNRGRRRCRRRRSTRRGGHRRRN